MQTSETTGFLHLSTEGWLFPVRRPDGDKPGAYLDPPCARITVFYVIERKDGYREFFMSFAFCSPEDAKIGVFNKSEGRAMVLRRFFGIDGESRQVARFTVHNDELLNPVSIYDIVLTIIKGISEGKWIVTNDVATRESDSIVPKVLCKDDLAFDWYRNSGLSINVALKETIGSINVPDWLVNMSRSGRVRFSSEEVHANA